MKTHAWSVGFDTKFYGLGELGIDDQEGFWMALELLCQQERVAVPLYCQQQLAERHGGHDSLHHYTVENLQGSTQDNATTKFRDEKIFTPLFPSKKADICVGKCDQVRANMTAIFIEEYQCFYVGSFDEDRLSVGILSSAEFLITKSVRRNFLSKISMLALILPPYLKISLNKITRVIWGPLGPIGGPCGPSEWVVKKFMEEEFVGVLYIFKTQRTTCMTY